MCLPENSILRTYDHLTEADKRKFIDDLWQVVSSTLDEIKHTIECWEDAASLVDKPHENDTGA